MASLQTSQQAECLGTRHRQAWTHMATHHDAGKLVLPLSMLPRSSHGCNHLHPLDSRRSILSRGIPARRDIVNKCIVIRRPHKSAQLYINCTASTGGMPRATGLIIDMGHALSMLSWCSQAWHARCSKEASHQVSCSIRRHRSWAQAESPFAGMMSSTTATSWGPSVGSLRACTATT